MTAWRIVLGTLAVLHLGGWFLMLIGMGAMEGYRSAVTSRATDQYWAMNAAAVLLLAILAGAVLANFKVVMHAVTAFVVLAILAILLRNTSIGLACVPITALWTAFYAWSAWLR